MKAAGGCWPSPAAKSADPLAEGQAFLDANEPRKALDCFENFLSAQPQNPEALVKKASALEKLDRVDEALACCDRAIAADGAPVTAYLFKGGLLNRLQRYDEALKCYEQAMQARDEKIFEGVTANVRSLKFFGREKMSRLTSAATIEVQLKLIRLRSDSSWRRVISIFNWSSSRFSFDCSESSFSNSADALLVGAEAFEHRRLDGFEAARKFGEFRRRLLLAGEQFAALAGQFLHDGVLERLDQVRFEAGLRGLQHRGDAGRRQRLRFAVEHFADGLVGGDGAVASAGGTSHRHRHLSVHRLHVEGVFLAAMADDFDGNHAGHAPSPEK